MTPDPSVLPERRQRPGRRPGVGSRYWRIWCATAASNLGDGLTLVAMPLLAAAFTRDPLTIAGIGVFTPLAKIVVSLAGGVLVDRGDRRRVMIAADLVRLIAMGAFAALVASDDVSFPIVYLVVFLLGVGEFLYDTSAIALVRDVVPPRRLTTANGWLYAVEDGAQDLAAPPIGAALFGAAVWLPFAVDAGTFALSVLLLLSLRGRYRAERVGTRTTVRSELREGFRFAFGVPFFRSAAVMWVTLGFTLGATLSTLVLFVVDTLDAGELGYAAIITAGAVGIVMGNLFIARLERKLSTGGVLVGAISLSGIALIATGAAPVLAVAAVAQTAWGIGFALANTQMVSVRQRLVPDALLGRVTGVFGLLSAAGMVAGVVVGGVLTESGGPRVPILFAGVVTIAAGLLWFVLLRSFGGVEQAAAAPSRPVGS
ncbi:MAG: MFS transporter [Acidimicrobiia bacterium]